jgi:AcrR family transcriptional regulator
MPRSSQPPANVRGRRTRTALLSAGRQLLDERGFQALTMADVAERAGVSRAAVYLHFASRSELIGAVMDDVARKEGLDELAQPVLAAPDGLTALDAWVRLEATYHARILDVARAIERIRRDDPDAEPWARRVAAYQQRLCQGVAHKLADEHRLASGWTAGTAADMLWALMSTEPLERLLRDRGWSRADYAQRVALLLRSTFVKPEVRDTTCCPNPQVAS